MTAARVADDDRPILISGNWKMHENHFEAIKLIQELAALFRAKGIPTGREVSLHPPFTSLRTVQTAVETDHVPVALGAQTCHYDDRGAFTGEVSAEMLAKLNVAYVLCGHSERRQYCGETDEIVRKKIDAVVRHAMRPIVCVGESKEQRDEGVAESHVRAQVRAAFSHRHADEIARFVVAYEPIWAIGTGENATPHDAEEMAAIIRDELTEIGGATAATARVLYGGSVDGENAADLLEVANVDGLLVGGKSLDALVFAEIVHAGV